MAERTVSIVTGGSRGIGRAICVALGRLGHAVAVNYYRSRDAGEETCRSVEEAGGTALLCQADVGDAADRERMVGEIVGAFGRIDLLVNNAGVSTPTRSDLLDNDEASFHSVLNTDLTGAYFLTQRVAKLMIEQIAAGRRGSPAVVNISSISAYTASIHRGAYCIAKAGVAMMTKLYAIRLAEHDINVYEVCPGIIRTDMTAPVAGKYEQQIADGLTPLRRWGEPEDVAAAVVAIASGHLPFSTGDVINVDGGWHLRHL